jgi:hypothetical protein
MECMHAVQYVAQFHAMNVGIKHITASSFHNLSPITASHQQLLILIRYYITPYNCAELRKNKLQLTCTVSIWEHTSALTRWLIALQSNQLKWNWKDLAVINKVLQLQLSHFSILTFLCFIHPIGSGTRFQCFYSSSIFWFLMTTFQAATIWLHTRPLTHDINR